MTKATKKCPEDWKAPQSLREWANKDCPDVDYWGELAAFKDHEFATAKRDWTATARNWLRRAQKSAKPPWKQDEPTRVIESWEPPPQVDKFDRIRNRLFFYVCDKCGGFGKDNPIVDTMITRSKQLAADFRLLEADGEDVRGYTDAVLKAFREIYANEANRN